jgi:hypothetical protein
VEIYWLDPKTELGIGAADANGSFVQSFAVPAGLTPGPYAVSAYEGQLFVTAKTGYDVE